MLPIPTIPEVINELETYLTNPADAIFASKAITELRKFTSTSYDPTTEEPAVEAFASQLNRWTDQTVAPKNFSPALEKVLYKALLA